MLTAVTALALALSCAPHVSPDVLLSVAYAESHWNPLAIHDNRTGETILPANKAAAVRTASRLIAEGHQPDLGLLQINATNLARTRLTVATAFEPCASMRAGAHILLGGYQGGATAAQRQSAILHAISEYNTGSPDAGLDTYAPLVLAAARRVIPALRLPGIVPFVLPPRSPSQPTRRCDPDGWHFSAGDRACPANAGWHVSADRDPAVNLADPAVSEGHISKDPSR
ncbi:MAG TPA: lytic transglycosylase domain-containing protein [Acetobacteraceae bacterium]|nr:lytic transglycosylase domain-containing protein [Acetobacteraceae bacterium]